MYSLYLAEKPAAGKAIAQYLSKISGKPISPMRDHVFIGNDIAVGWLRGHLVENVSAEVYDPALKDWQGSAHMLPYIPTPFRLEVKLKTKDLFATAKGLVLKAGEVINCADPDDQGELLSVQFLKYVGWNKPVKRLRANDLTDKGLDRAFANIKDGAEFEGAYQSALAQSHADWLYGINMTRACTLEARKKGSRLLLNVGRVKTPVWAMLVRRELAIRTFVAQKHFSPWLDVGTKPIFRARWQPVKDDDRLDSEGRLVDAGVAAGIEKAVRGSRQAVVAKADTVPGNETAPMPFSLSALQAHASRLYGFSPIKTLEFAQSLYDKKLISYPRTPLEYIPETQHSDAGSILSSLAKAPLPTSFTGAIRGAAPAMKSRAFDTKKVDGASHHAIIPTELVNPGDIAALSDAEKKIYLEIVRRYLLQFWPVAKVMLTEIVLQSAKETFVAKGKRYADEGWKKAFTEVVGDVDADDTQAADAGDDQPLPELRAGMVLPVVESGIDSRVTTAPKRYNEGTLLTAMAKAHLEVKDPKIRERLKEKEGLGTEATRAHIIQDTVDNELFSLGGKGGREIIPSDDAIRFIGVLPETMTQPDLTALWQLYFDGIKQGKNTYADFILQQTAWLTKMVSSVSSYFADVKFDNLPQSAGGRASGRSGAEITLTEEPCNACRSPLKRINGKFGWFWACSSETCKKIFADLAGKPVEKTARPPEATTGISCPKCSKGFLRLVPRTDGSGSFWGCSAYRDNCHAAYNDDAGSPDLEGKTRKSAASGAPNKLAGPGCPTCSTGFLRLVQRADKSGSFWGCSAYLSGCKAIFNDDSGVPAIDGKPKSGGGGQRLDGTRVAASPPRPPSPGTRIAMPESSTSVAPGSRIVLSKFADRLRQHGGGVAYDPLSDIG